MKQSKRIRSIRNQIQRNRQYDFLEAMHLLKNLSTGRFVESVDVAVSLDTQVDPSEQNVRNIIELPYGTGKFLKIAVFSQEKDFELSSFSNIQITIGTDILLEQIKNKKIDFDILITTTDHMGEIGQLGHILGPRNVMPSLRMGTITENISQTIEKIRLGTFYRIDKDNFIRTSIGRLDFEFYKIQENLKYFISELERKKWKKNRGLFGTKKIFLSTTMGCGLMIDRNSLFDHQRNGNDRDSGEEKTKL